MEYNKDYLIRYKFSTTLFTEDGKYQFEPTRLDSLTVEADFAKSFTPMATLYLQLDTGQTRIVKKNQNGLLLSFKMEKAIFILDEKSNDRREVESEIIFDKVFIPIVESEDIAKIDEYQDYSDENRGTFDIYTDNPEQLRTEQVRMYISTLDYHLMYKKTYNTVLRGKNNSQISVDTALRFICETCGAKGYIIDPPDNVIPYENIIIPPGNVKYCLDMLQTMYGIYTKDLLSFYDFDGKLYILSRLKNEHEYEEGKPRETRLQLYTCTDDHFVPGLVKYEPNFIMHTGFNAFDDTSPGVAAGEAYGDSIIFTNFGFASEIFEFKDGKLNNVNPGSREYLRDAVSHKNTGMGLSFEYDELNNSFNMFSNLLNHSLNSLYIVRTKGMDIDCLKPNVSYSIELMCRDEHENDRFRNKKYPLVAFLQEFSRDNEVNDHNIYKTNEVVSLANMYKE